MCFVAKKNLHQLFLLSTGSDFETSRIARTGNEKSSSIAVRARSDYNYALKVKVH